MGTRSDLAFDKYQQDGAYHWRLTDQSWGNFDYNPPTEARFGALLHLLREASVPGSRMLDVGCGDGYLIGRVQEEHPSFELHGVDLEEEALRLAGRQLDCHGIDARLQQASAYDLPYADESMSVVFMTEVIEHLDAPEQAVKEAHRVLRSGGQMYVTTPHRQPDLEWDPDYHVHEFTWEELSSLLGRHFETVEGHACFPMEWMRFWRQGVWQRVAVRLFSRVFYNPMRKMEAPPSSDYGQMIAVCQKS